MNETARSVLARYRVGVVQALGALALALACGTACSIVPVSQSNHACADKVASAVTSGQNTPGMWQCLDPKLQASLHTLGLDGDSAFAFTGSTVISVKYIGASNGMDVYAVVGKSASGIVSLTLTVWVNSDGKVTNLAVGAPAF